MVPLREGQERVLVALGVGALDGNVGLVWRRLGRGVAAGRRAALLLLLLLLLLLGGRWAQAVHWGPQTRGRGSAREVGARRGQAAQAEAKQAVLERPAGRRRFGGGRRRGRGRSRSRSRSGRRRWGSE